MGQGHRNRPVKNRGVDVTRALLEHYAQLAHEICPYCLRHTGREDWDMDVCVPFGLDHGDHSVRADVWPVLLEAGRAVCCCRWCNRLKGAREAGGLHTLRAALAHPDWVFYPSQSTGELQPRVLVPWRRLDAAAHRHFRPSAEEKRQAVLATHLLALRVRNACRCIARITYARYDPEALTLTFACESCWDGEAPHFGILWPRSRQAENASRSYARRKANGRLLDGGLG